MRLRPALTACVVAAIVLVAMRWGSIAHEAKTSALLDQQRDAVDLILRDAAGLLVLTQDYALHQTPRAAIQWKAVHARLSETLGRFASTAAHQADSVQKLQDVAAPLPQVFDALVETIPGGLDPEVVARRDTLIDQLVTESSRISEGAYSVSHLESERRRQQGVQQRWLALAAQTTSLLITLLLAWLLLRRVLDPIDHLSEVASKVGAGDLGRRSGYYQADELGSLAQALDNMTEALAQRDTDLRQALDDAASVQAAKSAFLANLSHEIRSPLHVVLGLSHVLGQTRLDVDQRALLDRLLSANRSVMDLINDVLDLSRMEAGEMSLELAPFRLQDLLAEVRAAGADQAGDAGCTFTLHCAPELPERLIGDAGRLRQVLNTLVSNAFKFTREGQVRVSAERVGGGGQLTQLCLVVEDTGIGIAAERLPLLFKRCAQSDVATSQRYSGGGLGLSIVGQLVEMMGGEVAVHSQLGLGSRFELRLPLVAELLGTQPMPFSTAADLIQLPGTRVLVVDDSPINREVAQRILSRQGAGVTLARDGAEALALLRAQPKGFDVVLLDVQMPVMDGPTAAELIRGDLGLCELPLLALTAVTLFSERQRAVDAGMDGFITKPFDPEALVSLLRQHIERVRGSRLLPQPRPPGGALPPVRAASDWPYIEGIDRADVHRRLHGDLALFTRLLGRLCEEFGDLAAPPTAPLEAVAAQPLAARLYTLAGSASLLGAVQVHAAAMAAQLALRSGAEAGAALAAVARAMAPLVRAAEALLAAHAEAEPAAILPTAGVAVADWALLQARLRTRDLAALSQCRALAPTLRARWPVQRLQVFEAALERLDFETALRCLGDAP